MWHLEDCDHCQWKVDAMRAGMGFKLKEGRVKKVSSWFAIVVVRGCVETICCPEE